MKLSPQKKPVRQLRKQGIVLVECMVYLAVVMVILGLALNVYLKLLGFHRDLERNSNDIARTTKAGEIWRTDVRSATGPIQIEKKTDELLLTIPNEQGSTDYTFRDGSLWRQESGEPAPRPFLTQLATCKFTQESRTYVDAWSWDVTLKTKKKTVRIEPQFSFLAVPRGKDSANEG